MRSKRNEHPEVLAPFPWTELMAKSNTRRQGNCFTLSDYGQRGKEGLGADDAMGHGTTRAAAEIGRNMAGVQRCFWEQGNGGRR